MPVPPAALTTLQSRFEADLPRLQRVARFRLRRFAGEARDEAIAETIALCWQAYVRLFERGECLGVIERYAQKVAEFSAKRVLCGRLLTCNRAKAVVPRALLDDPPGGHSPAELATLRVDFERWLATLRPGQRQVIEGLAAGKNTVEVGRERGVTGGAVSNMRQALRRKWEDQFREPGDGPGQ